MANKRENYIGWDQYFMGVAMLSAQRSKDPNTQVGACIVSKDMQIYFHVMNVPKQLFNLELKKLYINLINIMAQIKILLLKKCQTFNICYSKINFEVNL